MSDIARAAGLTKPALYHYFATKADLFTAVVDHEITELLRYLAPAAAHEGPRRARLRALLEAVTSFTEDRPRSMQLLFRTLEEDHPDVVNVHRATHDAILGFASMLLPEDVADLGLAADTPRGRVTGELVAGAVVSSLRWWQRDSDLARDELLDIIDETLWKGLAGIGAAARRRRVRGN